VRPVPRDTAVGLQPGVGAGVPVTPAPPRGLPARLRLRFAPALVALAVAAGLVAGAVALTRTTPSQPARPAAPATLHGVTLQSANCTTWWTASESERMGAIHGLSRSIGGPTPYGPGTTLPDARVHRLFDTVCAPTFASHFLLYEVYVRAAGLKSLGG
jgi:hypothetical protein